MTTQDPDPVHVDPSLAPFAMVPRWLVRRADDRAVRLYALLTEWEWRDEDPTRAELAEVLAVSTRSIDRSLRLLEEAGAVNVIARFRDGSRVASAYRVNRGYPQGDATPVSGGGDTGVAGPAATPVSHLSSTEETSDTEREPRAEPASLFGDDPQPPKPSRRKPERPIPDGWQPDDRLREWAAANAPGVDVDHEAGRFVDHALSVDRRARDWPAAFRNWLRKAAERVPRGTGSPGPGRRYEGAESHDAGYWTPEGASLLLDEEDGRG